jgi:membrane-associated phospholipid phosphatase
MKYRINPAMITSKSILKCIVLICTLLLGWLCQEVWQKESWQLDTKMLLDIHHWASPVLDRVMLSITSLCDPEFVVVIVTLSAGWLLWRRQLIEVAILTLACFGALILNEGMKLLFSRPRPTLWPSLLHETTFGFPSGHALGSIVLYGLLAYFYASYRPHHAKGIYLLAAILIGLIGFSRLYLGVHYPTDIIAGYITGWLWLIACIELLKAITSATAQMVRLTEDLLLLARADAAAEDPTAINEKVNVVEILNNLGQIYSATAINQQITINMEPSLYPIYVVGKADQLTRLFTNLIINAIQHTPAGGVVDVKAITNHKNVQICVIDTGVGIAPEHLERLFDRFWRADQSRTYRQEGLGLGLSIVQAIVQSHGGSITVTSKLNEGSCFTVKLPMI